MLVYAGVALMVGSWFEIVRTLRRHPQAPLGPVAAIAVAWALPVLVMPPLFSRDVYSYVAQGEMITRGFNPYVHGPNVLGSGPDPQPGGSALASCPRPVRAGVGASLERHRRVWRVTTFWLRSWDFALVALVGVALIAWGVRSLARSTGRDEAVAFALAVLNPLVLLVLLGGAHNDALMLGLLVAGCALARRGHVVIGLAFCALAGRGENPGVDRGGAHRLVVERRRVVVAASAFRGWRSRW